MYNLESLHEINAVQGGFCFIGGVCFFLNFMRLMFSLVTVSLSIKLINGTYSKILELKKQTNKLGL